MSGHHSRQTQSHSQEKQYLKNWWAKKVRTTLSLWNHCECGGESPNRVTHSFMPLFTDPVIRQTFIVHLPCDSSNVRRCKEVRILTIASLTKHSVEYQGWLDGCAACATAQGPELRRASHLTLYSAITTLKFLIIFEEGAAYHFYFVLGSWLARPGISKLKYGWPQWDTLPHFLLLPFHQQHH